MTGALLINLGTPEAPTPQAVRTYLAEFLMDPLVIDIPYVYRWLLVHGIILRTRPAKTAAAYRKVWTEGGSPLLTNTRELTEKVRSHLPSGIEVEFGMRYGKPSIAEGVDRLIKKGVTRIFGIPLYPQYSLAATESSIVELKSVLSQRDWKGKLEVLPDFYEEPGFIASAAAVAQAEISSFKPDHVLLSFHGLPERQVLKSVQKPGNELAPCFSTESCCDRVSEENRNCYRAQCFATARALAKSLGLEPSKYSVGFQSRLGKTPWIQPFSDRLYQELPKKGVKRLAVICPSFVADCLETLEEVQIRGQEQFREAGGQDLKLISCVNADNGWAKVISEWITQNAKS